MTEDIADVNKAIEDYQKDIVKKNFVNNLKILLQEAEIKKNAGRTEESRHWAVVYTELEKVSAYVHTYLGV